MFLGKWLPIEYVAKHELYSRHRNDLDVVGEQSLNTSLTLAPSAYPFQDSAACFDGSFIRQSIFCCSSYSPDTCPHPAHHFLLPKCLLFIWFKCIICVLKCFCSGSTFHICMWQLQVCMFVLFITSFCYLLPFIVIVIHSHTFHSFPCCFA